VKHDSDFPAVYGKVSSQWGSTYSASGSLSPVGYDQQRHGLIGSPKQMSVQVQICVSQSFDNGCCTCAKLHLQIYFVSVREELLSSIGIATRAVSLFFVHASVQASEHTRSVHWLCQAPDGSLPLRSWSGPPAAKSVGQPTLHIDARSPWFERWSGNNASSTPQAAIEPTGRSLFSAISATCVP